VTDDIILSDLSTCLPGEALTRRTRQPGTWMLFDFETETVAELPAIRGTMVYGASRLSSPPLTLPLPVKGWYSIYIGCWHDIHVGGSQLRLQLRQDRFYRQIEPEETAPKDGDFPGHKFGPGDATEVFWRVAFLQDEALRIDRVHLFHELAGRGVQAVDRDACLAWVRLRPATERERARYVGHGKTVTPTTQFGMYDNGNWFQKGCVTDDDLRASIDWFAGTDMNRVLWGCYSNEGACYPSRLAEPMARDPQVTRCVQEFLARGVDPLALALEHANEVGVQLYPSYRIGGRRAAPTVLTTNDMPFFDANQDKLCVAADGTPTCHYSFAYEEVRQYFTDLLREVVENYDVPGVHFLFVRSNPFALYEEKTREEFRQTHGTDPRTLAEEDPAWWAHRAAYVTQFVRQLRETLDDVGAAKGRRLELAVSVPPLDNGPTWCVDGATWAREGLVDYLIIHAGGILPAEGVAQYCSAIGDTATELIVDFYPRRMPAQARLLRALQYYEAGAGGFCFWDGQTRVTRASEFATGRFLGHREDLADWAQEMEDPFRVVPLRTLQGYSMDRRYWSLTNG
jgi:hypothetical protein